ncbi:hypothetical protein DICPUDRAFT_156431 [Dictyostelium purpureum]|uniref:CBS domain-containing protein n=1 Tax=Dictyostelium purpureum TaxID=5786 RepID=F0ZWJ9_DICPU|nr:uncharacterized protein DICPUDRAFT_156431 [Dictyostelium purpureum]EGC31695.1 hypothetical protein DICPUDRAFT_156431 [Dictyostelium purpureum]|eukprot:XP_003291793.1 hypothetical protein DICPUDRAFT_156431 [Dictyostelium purpureum]
MNNITTKEKDDRLNLENLSISDNNSEDSTSSKSTSNNNNSNNNDNNNGNLNSPNSHLNKIIVNCNSSVSPPVFSLIKQSYINPTQVFIVCSKWTSFLNGRTVKNFLIYKKDINKSYRNKIPSDLVAVNINTSLEDSLYILSENEVASSPVMEEDDEIGSPDDDFHDTESSDSETSSNYDENEEGHSNIHVISPSELKVVKKEDLNSSSDSVGSANSSGSNGTTNGCSSARKKNFYRSGSVSRSSHIHNHQYHNQHHIKGAAKKSSSPYHHGHNHNTHHNVNNNPTTPTNNLNGNGNKLNNSLGSSTESIGNSPKIQKKKYKYRGLVGVLDILSFMSYLLHRRKILGLSPDHTNILKQSLKQVISFSTLNDMRYVKEDMSLLQALEVLISKSPPFKVHRVPVFNNDNELVGILSQTDFLYLARENLHQISNHSKKSVKELKIMYPVVSIPSSTITKDAFTLLRSNRINGVAITDDESGKLIHCLSSDDLKNITSLKFDLLFKTIHEYLEASGGLKKPFTISEDTSLVDAIIKMCDYKVQRLFTVSDDFKPRTVTTISDVLLILLNC